LRFYRELFGAFVLIFAGAGFNPATAAEGCPPLVLSASVDLLYDSGGRPVVPVTLNGEAKHLLVDTGGYASALTSATFEGLRLQRIRSPGKITHSATGFSSDQFGIVGDFRLANLRATNHDFYVLPEINRFDRELDGILGGEVLRAFDVELDLVAHKFRLFRQGACSGIYWQPRQLAILPFRLEGGDITFDVKVDGQTVRAILDTGAVNTVMNLVVAKQLFNLDLNGPDLRRLGVVEGISRADTYEKRFNRLEFEGITVNNPMIQLWPDFGPANEAAAPTDKDLIFPPLIIGMSVVNKLHILISYGTRKIYITEPATPGAELLQLTPPPDQTP
jgi:hypothetical protein